MNNVSSFFFFFVAFRAKIEWKRNPLKHVESDELRYIKLILLFSMSIHRFIVFFIIHRSVPLSRLTLIRLCFLFTSIFFSLHYFVYSLKRWTICCYICLPSTFSLSQFYAINLSIFHSTQLWSIFTLLQFMAHKKLM